MKIFAAIKLTETPVKERQKEGERERRLHLFNYLDPYETTLIITERSGMCRHGK